jgi:hypothetical protein
LAFSVAFRLVNPGTLFPDIGDVEEIGIKPFGGDGISKSNFMHPWRTGGNHDPVNREFTDIPLDQILSRVRAEITVVPGDFHSRKGTCETRKFLTVNGGCDIGTAMTDVDADL